MDFTKLGIDLAMIGAIVALAQAFKKLVLEPRQPGEAVPEWIVKRYKNFPVLIVLVLSVAAAFAMARPVGWQTVLENVIKYAGASSLLYATGKLVIGL